MISIKPIIFVFTFFIILLSFPVVDANYSKVAPYDTLQNGSANWNSQFREYFTNYHAYRIRQDGNITNISINIVDRTKLTSLNITFWRANGSNFDRVGITENLTSLIYTNGNNTINLTTPVPVLEGDYYGYQTKSTANTMYARAVPGGNSYYVPYMVNGSDLLNFSWTTKTTAGGFPFVIEFFMISPHTVFIGDSIIAGHNAHYSYIEPINTNNINSTIERNWFNITNISYQNMGVGGNTTNNILSRFTSDAVALSPQFVIINGGVNDIDGEVITNETILNNYEQMITDAENASITPVILLILPWSAGNNSEMGRVDYVNSQLISKKANHTSLIIVDARCNVGVFRAGGPAGNCWDIKSIYKDPDNTHYNAAGHKEIASSIYSSYNIIYLGSGLVNSIGVSGNINYSKTLIGSSKVNLTAIPSSGTVDILISTWNTTGDYYKKWNENSTNLSLTTQHTIGDFPPTTSIQIRKNGSNWNTYTSNSSGYISFNYNDGYDAAFEALLAAPPSTELSQTANPIAWLLMTLTGIVFAIGSGIMIVNFVMKKEFTVENIIKIVFFLWILYTAIGALTPFI